MLLPTVTAILSIHISAQ